MRQQQLGCARSSTKQQSAAGAKRQGVLRTSGAINHVQGNALLLAVLTDLELQSNDTVLSDEVDLGIVGPGEQGDAAVHPLAKFIKLVWKHMEKIADPFLVFRDIPRVGRVGHVAMGKQFLLHMTCHRRHIRGGIKKLKSISEFLLALIPVLLAVTEVPG